MQYYDDVGISGGWLFYLLLKIKSFCIYLFNLLLLICFYYNVVDFFVSVLYIKDSRVRPVNIKQQEEQQQQRQQQQKQRI